MKNKIPVPNWERRVNIDIACGLLGDSWLSFINECLERVDPEGEEALNCAKEMYKKSSDATQA